MTARPVLTRDQAAACGLVEPVQAANVCPCPRCGSIDIWPEHFEHEDWSLYCRTCQWTGPQVAAEAEVDEALAAWNREARQVQEARALGLRLCFVQPPLPAEARA